MISGSDVQCTCTLGRQPALWLALPGLGVRPPPRSAAADRTTRASLFARLVTAGVATSGGAALSHSAGYVAYMCSPCAPTGIDLEWVRERDVTGLARFAFSTDEADLLDACGQSERSAKFTELWVLKEAAAKVLGLDLFPALAQCRFRIDSGVIEAVLPGAERWHAALYAPRPELRLASLAIMPSAQMPRPPTIEWRADTGETTAVPWPIIAQSRSWP